MSRLVPASHRLCLAPMMDCTDRHCRYFVRQISRHIRLYTEMVTVQAILRGRRDRLLAFDAAEHPVALQLGGDDPAALAMCARIGEELGYDEINLNVGCPSPRVRHGAFGACLMLRPEAVADAVAAMRARVRVPVTVKHRIGVDDRDAFDDMARFVEVVAAAGCDAFIVHARKAWLDGLSPRQNREIPPLRHADVHRLKRDRPDLVIVTNGGIVALDAAEDHLRHVDGVMIGRAAYDQPYLLAEADRRILGDGSAEAPSRSEVVARMLPYIAREVAAGEPLARITLHMRGLFHGAPRAGLWRRHLSEHARQPGAGVGVVADALVLVDR